MLKRVKLLADLWITGVVVLLAGAGFVAYFLLEVFRRMQRSAFFLVAVILVLLGALLGGGAAYLLIAPSGNADPVIITVEKGQTLRTVSRNLQEKKVIRSSRALVLVMKALGRDRSFQAGRYEFAAGTSLLAALDSLDRPRPIERPITFPEGMTLWQTASVAAAVFDVDSMQFVDLCADTAFIRSQGLSVATLEGYLYPDTYRFAPQINEKEIVLAMLRRFREVWSALTIDFTNGVALDNEQAVILASIVEEEATLPAERGIIAGVFHNRLRLGYTLGADPTVRYALRKWSGPLRVSELNNPSPYNTRLHRGLPPGPICSPGRGALAAALSPERTDALYFVAKWDGSGEHAFSRTMEEHNRKKLTIRHSNEQRLRMQNR